MTYLQDPLAKCHLKRRAAQKNWDVYNIGDHLKMQALAWSCPPHSSQLTAQGRSSWQTPGKTEQRPGD